MNHQVESKDKLYVVVRADLTFGQQSSQIVHAQIQFGFEHSDIFKEWFAISNYICLLQIPNEEELFNLTCKAKELGIKYSEFREPDLEDSLTAICLAPGKISKKLVSKLKLAFT